MKQSNILFICEDKNDDKLLNIVLDNCKLDINFNIYKYNTNIHLFAKHLFQNYALDNGEVPIEDIDVLQILKEFRYEEILDKKYTDILFVFDYDPQDPRFNAEILVKLTKIFSDSTDLGQLFINYPMVEAAIDFASIPDPGYNEKVYALKDLKFNGYKNFIKKNSVMKYIDNICQDNLPVI